MDIAYYAPLKSPLHPTPSGDRRVAGLLMQALARAGHTVRLASDFSSYDKAGDQVRQAALRDEALALADRLIAEWRSGVRGDPPQAWFTYHVFYKAPDWVGPRVSAALGIPYVIAEASHAPKRAGGAWAIGHDGCTAAIRSASLVVCPTGDDVAGVHALLGSAERILHLPPFLDLAPFEAPEDRSALRAMFKTEHALDERQPWLLAVAMMRPGDKQASFEALGDALTRVLDLPWQLIVAGDGPARPAIVGALTAAVGERARFAGQCDLPGVIRLCRASDVFAWPAVNEAYGMAMLEAQAAGLPVVSSRLRGVPDVVVDGRTGLLATPGDRDAFAACVRTLLTDPGRRRAMGVEAARFVAAERGLDVAARRLGDALTALSPQTPCTNVTQRVA